YVCRKKVYKNKNEKEILLITLKSRYPFMKSKKRKEIVEKCKNIKELIYEVLKIDFIDFDVQKSEPIKEQVDKIIDTKLRENYNDIKDPNIRKEMI
ncbi:unnamed protein product, partial [marine sediment metagenome]